VRCALCGREAEDEDEDEAKGWRAYLTHESDDETGVGVFCPECTDREFGPPC
jgi:DNA-directed RNA polymerase subunit RPC12/RpoP